jgi:hypothetical protein
VSIKIALKEKDMNTLLDQRAISEVLDWLGCTQLVMYRFFSLSMEEELSSARDELIIPLPHQTSIFSSPLSSFELTHFIFPSHFLLLMNLPSLHYS